MNEWIGTGRLTRDPDIKISASGKRYAKYSIAVDRYAGGKKSTDFIECVGFGKQTEFAEKYLFKGRLILVKGTLATDSYTNRDGNRVNTFNIMVDKVELLSRDERPKGSIPEGQVQDDDFFTKLADGVPTTPDGFIDVPDDVGDEGLPFN